MTLENYEEFARQRLDHNRQRLALREQQEQRLTLAYAGGMFLVTTELMALLATWPENDILYLVDSYENPVEIVDATDMLVHCRQRWYEVMNDWHNQYQELKKVRRVGQLSE